MRAVRRILSTATITILALGGAVSTAGPSAAAPPTPLPPGVNDFCGRQCNDILPPGQNGYATFADLLLFQLLGIRPPHASDQVARYEQLVWNYTGLTTQQLNTYFNDSSFGVPADQVERRYSPRGDVTIVRDRRTGTPHIYGGTRAAGMFGAGFAAGEDRLFLIDVLRHVGRGQLTPFAGGAPGNRAFEQQQWAVAPYTEEDLQRQIDQLPALYGADGQQLVGDVLSYVDGLNAAADQQRRELRLPGEYTALGRLGGPDRFVPTDVVAIGSLVGGIFGRGGGGEVASALALLEARAKFGTTAGTQVWQAFRAAEDPEAPLTIHDGSTFPYGQTVQTPPGQALPDRGSVTPEPLVTNPTGTATADRSASLAVAGSHKGSMSNALVVSGQNTESGHPIAVFGPQTAYFAPQLLMLEEIQAPGVSVRGAAFAGLNFFVQLGRGQDYSWSATSAGQDITDTFAVPLCEPGGGTPTTASTHYEFHGQCLPFERLERRNSWTPTLADSTPAGSYTLVALRSRYGLVSHRGTVGGRPVAFTRLRSTYRHEVDSGIGFERFNDPASMRTASDFQRSAGNIGYTFNWFYANSREAAYFNSGNNPVRATGADMDLPTWGMPQFEWQDWNPDTNIARYTPFEQHPRSTDQDYYTSWNNKQAKGFHAADDQYGYSAVYRSQPLDDRIKAVIGTGKMTRVKLVQAMEDAATVDLRGAQVLPLALQVIQRGGAVTDPALADAVAKLQAWTASGAHRISRQPGRTTYDDAAAIQLLDAWWPRLVAAEFGDDLGAPLFGILTALLPVDERPHDGQGSAFQSGWWGYVSKDLRSVLGQPVAGPLPARFCGAGDLASCRQVLLDTLRQAAAVPATQVYPAVEGCAAGDQFCADAIRHRAIGGITQPQMEWVNRPTFQQVVEYAGQR